MSKELNSVGLITEILPGLGEIKKPLKKSVKKSVTKGTAEKKPTAANIKTLKKKPITKKMIGTDENTEKPQASMYIDFPSKNNAIEQPKMNRVRLIIQLMALLVPDRLLLQSFVKLIKVFISVAFFLSAIYAACAIYSNLIE